MWRPLPRVPIRTSSTPTSCSRARWMASPRRPTASTRVGRSREGTLTGVSFCPTAWRDGSRSTPSWRSAESIAAPSSSTDPDADRILRRRGPVCAPRRRLVPARNQRPSGQLHDGPDEVGRLWRPAARRGHWPDRRGQTSRRLSMSRLHHFLAASLVLAAAAGQPRPLGAQPRPSAPEVLLRLDDVGMNHSVNLAIEKVAATGMPFSVSVLFACPWYQEAVEILKKHPQVAVGVHLALNSEWRNYRWGPVLGKGAVPSLVDSVGYFLPSSEAFLASKYDLGEVERELSAQVERALASGLKITYVDAHMGMVEGTPQLREVEERVARKYGLGISTYFGESYHTLWGVPVASKKSALLAHLADARRDTVNLIEVHVAERTPEMEVIVDMNAPAQNAPDAGVVAHRKAELETMLSPELAELVRSGKIRLVTYRELAARAGTAGMRRPR